MPFRPEDYADQRPVREDDEPVYPDGTPRYECWNAAVLKKKPVPAKKPAVRKDTPDDAWDED